MKIIVVLFLTQWVFYFTVTVTVQSVILSSTVSIFIFIIVCFFFQVDVYSFGVLLCEMCVREMPDPKRRNQQVLLVKSHVLRNLVLECLQDNPAERPEMSEIIKEIERFEG